MSDNFLEAGKIVNVHGLRGEVKIMPWCDGPDFLCEFDYLYLDKNGNRELEVEKARVFKNMVIAKFRDVDTVEDAEKLREKVLYISRDDVELDEDTPEALANEIMRFHDMREDERDQIGRNAREGATNFDFHVLTGKLIQVIESVISCRE